MLYVTLLDQFHPGIYSSQVIDVCDYLNEKHKAGIRVVAFLSVRELVMTNSARELKKLSPDAIVVPAVPGLGNFRWNVIALFFICLVLRERKLICRNAFATEVALKLRRIGLVRKVILDGRSALAAESEEYNVFPVASVKKQISQIEREAVLQSDFRIAVSEGLVHYWRNRFGYESNNHVIIPSTLDRKYFTSQSLSNSGRSREIRKSLSFSESDIVLVYSGSTAPWQSFTLLSEFLVPLLKADGSIKVLFLSRPNEDIASIMQQFPGRIYNKWVPQSEISDYLVSCDYGLLFREQSMTNKVASPVKFAEYLYSGLNILISKNLGDLSAFVKEHNCGFVLPPVVTGAIFRPSITRKEKSHELANTFFSKDSPANANSYSRLMMLIKD
jgi:hypothetical protein